MPFKEGVTDQQVHLWRAFVKSISDLDAKVDGGTLTPDEAFDEATKSIEKTPVIIPAESKEKDGNVVWGEKKAEKKDDHARTHAPKHK